MQCEADGVSSETLFVNAKLADNLGHPRGLGPRLPRLPRLTGLQGRKGAEAGPAFRVPAGPESSESTFSCHGAFKVRKHAIFSLRHGYQTDRDYLSAVCPTNQPVAFP